MDLSPFLRHFPLIVCVGMTMDHRTGSLRPWLILWAASCCSAVTVCNVIVYVQRGLKEAILYGQTRDTVQCLYILFHIPILIQNRSKARKLIDLLLTPFEEIPLNTDHPEIIKDYVKWITIFGGVFIFNNFFILCCLSMILGPLLVLPFYPSDTRIVDYPLPIGQIPFQTDSHWIYALAYLISATAIFSVVAFYTSWFLILVYSSLRIKALLQMLSCSILSLNSRAAALSVTMRDLTGSDYSAFQEGTTILRQAVLFHQDIIQYVKELKDTFRMSLLLTFQMAIITAALSLDSMMNPALDLSLQNYLVMGNLTFAATFTMGVYCFCGQHIISESRNLEWALYECACSDQPLAIKRSLLIMMTVSSRPLSCTVGGLYPLSLASYATTLQAIYSYVNLLFTLRQKQLG